MFVERPSEVPTRTFIVNILTRGTIYKICTFHETAGQKKAALRTEASLRAEVEKKKKK